MVVAVPEAAGFAGTPTGARVGGKQLAPEAQKNTNIFQPTPAAKKKAGERAGWRSAFEFHMAHDEEAVHRGGVSDVQGQHRTDPLTEHARACGTTER